MTDKTDLAKQLIDHLDKLPCQDISTEELAGLSDALYRVANRFGDLLADPINSRWGGASGAKI
jgi:hypothetical protein